MLALRPVSVLYFPIKSLPNTAVLPTPEARTAWATAQASTKHPRSFAARQLTLRPLGAAQAPSFLEPDVVKTTDSRFLKLQKQFSDPLLTALTIMLAVIMFVVSPMQAVGIVQAHHFGIAFALLLVVAIFIVSGSVPAVVAVLTAVGLVLIATVLRLRHPSTLDVYLDASAWLIGSITLGVVVARAVFAPGRVTFHRIVGAVQLYLDIGLMFVALFCFVAVTVPDAFVGLKVEDNLALIENLIYFSFATLTSVGYGDVTPFHPYARSLANIEAIIGQLYPATLLARLVTLELEGRRTR